MTAARAVLAGLLLLLCGADMAQAQQVAPRPQAAVIPEGITVGDVFHAAVRVELPAGGSVVPADSLLLPPDIEAAGRREIRLDSVGGVARATIVYPLTAWRPGSYELGSVSIRVLGDGGATTLEVPLPSFAVRSVLPADTAGIEPRAAKDVFGANRLWWPIVLALLLVAGAAAALWLWWRSRSRPAVGAAVAAPATPPRRAALEQLHALRRERLIERGEIREFYLRLSETLRRYTAALGDGWGADLTTAELGARMRAAGFSDGMELIRMLGAADLVKFARVQASQDAAARDLDAAQLWVERTEPVGAAEGSDERRVA
jgi:hypothetical protein